MANNSPSTQPGDHTEADGPVLESPEQRPDSTDSDGPSHTDGSSEAESQIAESTVVESEAPPIIRLKKRRALPFFNQHPWVFAGAIQAVSGHPQVGDEVLVKSYEGESIARGLFNPISNIRARLYSWDLNVSCDPELMDTRIRNAVGLRRQLFGGTDNRALRYVNSEGDGVSGLTVDGYGSWLCVQVTSAALATQLGPIVESLKSALSPTGIWLRTEKGIRESEGLEIEEGIVFGTAPEEHIVVLENDIKYHVDVMSGQKTGFYCDQRGNRKAVAGYLSHGKLLDVCCYSGGFGLNAVIHGNVDHVVGIDSSDTALELAASNAELNGVAEKFEFQRGQAAEVLKKRVEAGEKYSGVVLDPPKMARNRGGLQRAMKGYRKLNQFAVQLLNPGGILATCSCSGLVTREIFEEMLAEVATQTGRQIQILETRGAAADHPVSVSCRESEYLKCYICRVS